MQLESTRFLLRRVKPPQVPQSKPNLASLSTRGDMWLSRLFISIISVSRIYQLSYQGGGDPANIEVSNNHTLNDEPIWKKSGDALTKYRHRERQNRTQHNIRTCVSIHTAKRKAPATTTLSSLAPALFCPPAFRYDGTVLSG